MTLTNTSVTQPRGGVLVFAFAIFCYVAFLAAMGLMALFLLNLGPAKVSGPVQGPVAPALAGNLFLVFLFGFTPVSYTHLTLPTNTVTCRSRWWAVH